MEAFVVAGVPHDPRRARYGKRASQELGRHAWFSGDIVPPALPSPSDARWADKAFNHSRWAANQVEAFDQAEKAKQRALQVWDNIARFRKMRVLWHRLDPCGYRMLLAMEKKQSQEIASVHDKASRLLQLARTGYQLVVKAAKAARRAHARLDGLMAARHTARARSASLEVTEAYHAYRNLYKARGRHVVDLGRLKIVDFTRELEISSDFKSYAWGAYGVATDVSLLLAAVDWSLSDRGNIRPYP
jgi:hypothetical protein